MPSLLLVTFEGAVLGEVATSLEYVFWDDRERYVGRRVRSEGQYLNFAPKPLPGQHTFVNYSEHMDDGRARVLMKSIGQYMIRRSGAFRPVIPWQTLCFYDYNVMVHTPSDVDLDLIGLTCRICSRSRSAGPAV